MEDAKVLSAKHRAAGFYGLMSLSALSALGSFWLSVAPPILRDARIEQAIAESMARGESYVGAAPVNWAKALSGLAGASAQKPTVMHLASSESPCLQAL